jgi:putative SOS response-associated peptidase YedK
MCGRFTHLYTWRQLHRLLSLTSAEVELPHRYNVAPTQVAPVVMHDDDAKGLTLRMMRWGLVPSWAKEIAIGNSLINARSEGVSSKPSFRAAFKKRRCIVPMSGFYEWQKVEGSRTKQPYYIIPARPGSPTSDADESRDPWLCAGLWEAWHDPALASQAPALQTFTIITTDANEAMAPIHNRMPVMLDIAQARRWVSPETDASELAALLKPCPSNQMAFRRVSTLVNSPRHDSAQCIQEAAQQDFGNIFDQKD